MEGHIGQLVRPGRHAVTRNCAQVIFPKEFRIRQPRCQHFLVARKDRRAIVGCFDVGNGHEFLDPSALGIAHGKELLVFPHRGLQHLWRQAQEIFANVAHQHDGPFDQTCDLGQKPFVFNHFQALRKGHVGGIGPDMLRPFTCIQHDMGAFQLGGIILE